MTGKCGLLLLDSEFKTNGTYAMYFNYDCIQKVSNHICSLGILIAKGYYVIGYCRM